MSRNSICNPGHGIAVFQQIGKYFLKNHKIKAFARQNVGTRVVTANKAIRNLDDLKTKWLIELHRQKMPAFECRQRLHFLTPILTKYFTSLPALHIQSYTVQIDRNQDDTIDCNEFVEDVDLPEGVVFELNLCS